MFTVSKSDVYRPRYTPSKLALFTVGAIGNSLGKVILNSLENPDCTSKKKFSAEIIAVDLSYRIKIFLSKFIGARSKAANRSLARHSKSSRKIILNSPTDPDYTSPETFLLEGMACSFSHRRKIFLSKSITARVHTGARWGHFLGFLWGNVKI